MAKKKMESVQISEITGIDLWDMWLRPAAHVERLSLKENVIEAMAEKEMKKRADAALFFEEEEENKRKEKGLPVQTAILDDGKFHPDIKW